VKRGKVKNKVKSKLAAAEVFMSNALQPVIVQ